MTDSPRPFSSDDIDWVLSLRSPLDVIWKGEVTRARYAIAEVAEIVAGETQAAGNVTATKRLQFFASQMRRGTYPSKKQVKDLGTHLRRMRQVADSL